MSDALTIAPSNPAASLIQSRADRVLNDMRDQAGSDPVKIQKAAREFEAILLAQWLEKAQKTFASVPGDTEDNQNLDPGHEQFQEMALQGLATGLSQKGGLGIGDLIVRQLQARSAYTEAVTSQIGTNTPGAAPKAAPDPKVLEKSLPSR